MALFGQGMCVHEAARKFSSVATLESSSLAKILARQHGGGVCTDELWRYFQMRWCEEPACKHQSCLRAADMKLISQLSGLVASQGRPDRDLGEASSVLLVV